jgi:hypothetical protein
MNLEVSDSGLHLQSVAEDSRITWSAFVGWSETNTVFALFPSPRTSFPIPKRAFTAAQLAEFHDYLLRNIKQAGGSVPNSRISGN